MIWNVSYYKNLKVWQKSIDFIELIYKTTSNFPKSELYGLTDQIRRASISIASNIAEWSGRWSENDYTRFLYIAKWSAQEIETQLIIAHRLKYIDLEDYEILESAILEIIKMISWLIMHKKWL